MQAVQIDEQRLVVTAAGGMHGHGGHAVALGKDGFARMRVRRLHLLSVVAALERQILGQRLVAHLVRLSRLQRRKPGEEHQFQ